jgi:hypothetical protein
MPNLKLAQDAVQHVQRLGPMSVNRPADVARHEGVVFPASEHSSLGRTLMDFFRRRFEPRNARQVAESEQNRGFYYRVALRDQRTRVIKKDREKGILEDRRVETGSVHDKLMSIGKAVTLMGLGNCGEQATVAYRFCVQHRCRNVTFINWKDGNHEFVVLDIANPGGGPWDYDAARPPADWGGDAVWCDPWAGIAFVVNGGRWNEHTQAIMEMANGRALARTSFVALSNHRPDIA